MDFMIKFWGTRGSIPSGLSPQELKKLFQYLLKYLVRRSEVSDHQIKSFLKNHQLEYGSDTSCVQVWNDKTEIIIDAGSGLRRLGQKIMNHISKYKEHHIFLTHFHWDHLIGLPFFGPLFHPEQKIHFYAVQEDLEFCIQTMFTKPFFPVSFSSLKDRVVFHRLSPRKPVVIGDFTVTPYQLDHPDPCWGYKIQYNNLAYAHCVDTEAVRISREELGDDLPLYQGINLMYFDAQYTLPERAEKTNWGHSASQIALDLALKENIPFVLFGHHDPGANIKRLKDSIRQTKDYYHWRWQSAQINNLKIPKVRWNFAYDGLVVNLNRLNDNKT